MPSSSCSTGTLPSGFCRCNGSAASWVEAGSLNGSDVHEYIAPAVVRLDEAVAPFGIEELDRTTHGHRETPIPMVDPPPAPTARRLGRTFTIGDRDRPHSASVTPPAPTG